MNRRPGVSESDLRRMRDEWDQRAKARPLHYNSPSRQAGEEQIFFEYGRRHVEQELLGEVQKLERPEQKRALEIGCGMGRLMRALAPHFASIDGVDVSPAMIKEARSHNPSIEYPTLNFQANDGSSLPFPDGRFAFVYSMGVLTHLPSRAILESYVVETARVLEPGGRFKLEVPVESGWGRLSGVIPYPRAVKPFVPSFASRLALRIYKKDPLKRSDTYIGKGMFRYRLKRIMRDAGLEGAVADTQQGRNGWLVGRKPA